MRVSRLTAAICFSALSILQAGCTPIRSLGRMDENTICPSDGTWCLQRIVDENMGVVCYKYTDSGISCVRIEP